MNIYGVVTYMYRPIFTVACILCVSDSFNFVSCIVNWELESVWGWGSGLSIWGKAIYCIGKTFTIIVFHILPNQMKL